MKIISFTKQYVEEAASLALRNYMEEQKVTQALPCMESVPDLSYFTENGLGVVALEQNKVVGFLGCYNPWEEAFDSLATGTYSPIHAHGAVKENRIRIYQQMYQEAADLWVRNKITYHAIGLYAHDQQATEAFYTYGFGLRCVDAIRKMEWSEDFKEDSIQFEELAAEKREQANPLRKLLSEHMGESPCFMYSSEEEIQQSLLHIEQEKERIFVAKEGEKIVAFLKIADEGENFVTNHKQMKNICGAFCLEAYRGRKIYQRLIGYVISKLRAEGNQYLGVDYESFNPTANRFWPKCFTPYTNSLVRRIDEGVLNKYK
ncbi:GNAT family N-acetyltransferase [Anaerosporobacter faecicola]|uniref:GNAT family N-acetyltransferase n=1 Tax=Anaerosporobacter faecicola TaxID=2718714 RepID=UPI00143C870E|nr:GNAT family N-acetyltransferase [Anaerosporobacter faecicola]